MTKKLFYSLYGLIICLFIIGCVRDERDPVSSANIPNDVTTTAYVKRSPWNENEAFIKYVQSSFLKNINLKEFQNKYGEVYWDYVISFPNQEAGLAIPIIKNNDVVAVLKATRKDGRINLKWVNEEDPKEFFRSLILKDTSLQTYNNGIEKGLRKVAGIDKMAVMEYQCTYKTVSIGCPNGQTDCTPMSKTVSECSWTETGGPDYMSIPDPLSNGGGGGGGGGAGGSLSYELFPESLNFIKPKYFITDIKKYLSCLNPSMPANLKVFAESIKISTNEVNVGHSFISISQGNNVVTFGFYPNNPDGKHSKSAYSDGIMGDNTGSVYDVYKDYGQISPDKLQRIINLAINYGDDLNYNLVNNNCSNFASDAMTIAGETNIAQQPNSPNAVISRFGQGGIKQPGTGPASNRTCGN
ncbi:hypothetical protein [Elizabethkingia anophelis]|uniref:hypothetical protein n=1 Tax=Elizabethkingia anophelis TaxID=1117645 RepID=UPI000B34C64B|nr:hypothetical protein [Elizabethkingia anophelis]